MPDPTDTPARLTAEAIGALTKVLNDPKSYSGEGTGFHGVTPAEVELLFEAIARLPVHIFRFRAHASGEEEMTVVGRTEEVFGRPREDVVGEGGAALIDPEDHQKVCESARKAGRSGKQLELVARASRTVDDESQEHWLITVARVRPDTEPVETLGITVRSREIAALQAALSDKAQILEDVTSSIPGAVYQWLLESDGTMSVPYISEGIRDVIGVGAEEIVANARMMGRYVFEEDVAGIIESIRKSAATLEGWSRSYSVRLEDGSVKALYGTGRPRRLKDGSTLWNSVTIDITEIERRNDEERERARARYQSQKLESLGRLAGGVAHDLNNLLVGVLGNASLLVEESDPFVRETSSDIQIAAKRCAELTEQILAFAGGGRRRSETIDLGCLVGEMIRLVLTGRKTEVSVNPEIASDRVTVRGDPVQLRQVVLNLLTNAIEAARGSVRVRVNADTDDWVRLSVEDDGSGIDPTVRDRIFEPFFSTKGRGRGLGLSASTGIVRAHNGTLSVESKPDHGARFEVRLPAVEDTEPLIVSDADEAPTRGQGRVLVIDDDSSVLQTASRVLTRRGFDVDAVESGAAAMALLAEGARFDYALVDLTMPDMSGPEVFHRLRAAMPDLPILFFSGFSETNVEDLLADERAVSFLAKPFTGDALVAALNGLDVV